MQAAQQHAQAADVVLQCAGTWWVAQTFAQSETRLVDEMRRLGATPIFPRETLVKTYTRPGGQMYRKSYERALFPGYVFLNLDPDHTNQPEPRGEQWFRARGSESTLKLIPVNDQRGLRTELSSILLWLETCDGQVQRTQKIEPGTMVRIINGPLRGSIAVWRVDRVDGGKVFLPINIMGRMVPTEVSIEDVEPATMN